MMKLLQSLSQIAATGLLILIPILGASPSSASLRCTGLVSSAGNTCVEGFQPTASRRSYYHYITRSPNGGGQLVSGTFVVTEVWANGMSGVFTDASLSNANEGCYGNFTIESVSQDSYRVTWNVQGATLGRTCRDAGQIFPIDNMRLGTVMF